MGEDIFTFLRKSKHSVSLITVPFCPVAPCPFQILAGVLLLVEIFISVLETAGRIVAKCDQTLVWGTNFFPKDGPENE